MFSSIQCAAVQQLKRCIYICDGYEHMDKTRLMIDDLNVHERRWIPTTHMRDNHGFLRKHRMCGQINETTKRTLTTLHTSSGIEKIYSLLPNTVEEGVWMRRQRRQIVLAINTESRINQRGPGNSLASGEHILPFDLVLLFAIFFDKQSWWCHGHGRNDGRWFGWDTVMGCKSWTFASNQFDDLFWEPR